MTNDSQKVFEMPVIIAIIAVVAVLGGVVYYTNQSRIEEDSMAEDKAMMEKKEGEMMKDEAMMQKGSYETYSPEKLSLATSGDVVLFFRASWCPTCRGLDADIRANLDKIPASVVILDVDYDTATALKQKYGVTYQHTFVQVDSNGNLIKKWSGSPTLSALVVEVK